jgi:DNA-directed RNA polymerase specialized sigma54-like protein
LLPLTQKQLALELDIGESTLSRLIKNKYMETPIGTIKIQDLFSANVGNHASSPRVFVFLSALKYYFLNLMLNNFL